CQSTGRSCVVKSGGVKLEPTIWPLSFTASAVLPLPPRTPRSIIPPIAVHEKACPLRSGRQNGPQKGVPIADACPLSPATWPLAFTADAELLVPPSVPRSIGPPVVVHENACVAASPAVALSPTTWPVAFTAYA